MCKGKVDLSGYKDSKKCSPKLRDELYQRISEDKNIQRATAKCEHSFVDKYSLEKELYNDLEEMIFDKLSNLKEINDLNVQKIIKEV